MQIANHSMKSTRGRAEVMERASNAEPWTLYVRRLTASKDLGATYRNSHVLGHALPPALGTGVR
jgi:hypothetical protein